MKISFLTILASFFLGNFAHATLDTCELSGTITLTKNTSVFCPNDLVVADGTKIVTNGFLLDLAVTHNIRFAEADGSFADGSWSIVSFDSNTAKGASAAITIYAAGTAFGHLDIKNDGATPADASGAVNLEFIATKDYAQTIHVGVGTVVNTIINGFVQDLVGSLFQLPAPSVENENK